MLIHKTYKFRIYPTKKQQEFFSKCFGCCRFIYNYFLHKTTEDYKNNKVSFSYCKCCKELTQLKKQNGYKWLQEVPNQILQQTLRDLNKAYQNFFKNIANFPTFKTKKEKQSSRYSQRFHLKGKLLILSKMPESIKINITREVYGNVKNITIKKSKTNNYFALLECVVDQEPLEHLDTKVGIDLGICNLVADSNFNIIKNSKLSAKNSKKITYLNKQISRKKRYSNSYFRLGKKYAVLHEKIKNSRQDNLHKISRKYINENQVICIEDLFCEEFTSKNRNINRSIYDASIQELKRQLEYKSKWCGRDLIEVDRYFPSSQLCNNCDYKNKELKLSDRTWKCPVCNSEHDRDINAAKNILSAGLKILSGLRVNSDNKQKQVEPSICGLEKSNHQEIEAVKPEVSELIKEQPKDYGAALQCGERSAL